MDMIEPVEFLNQYESKLLHDMIRLCTDRKELKDRLLDTPDITEKWDDIIKEYMIDAIKEYNAYPMAALGWAMYVGMGVAKYWDEDWEVYGKVDNLYVHMRDQRGFDYLDEVVRGDIYGYKDKDFTDCEDLVQSCAQLALDRIRHEQIEPQSPMAYYVFARSIKVLYLIGASVGLRRLRYNLVKA